MGEKKFKEIEKAFKGPEKKREGKERKVEKQTGYEMVKAKSDNKVRYVNGS